MFGESQVKRWEVAREPLRLLETTFRLLPGKELTKRFKLEVHGFCCFSSRRQDERSCRAVSAVIKSL